MYKVVKYKACHEPWAKLLKFSLFILEAQLTEDERIVVEGYIRPNDAVIMAAFYGAAALYMLSFNIL